MKFFRFGATERSAIRVTPPRPGVLAARLVILLGRRMFRDFGNTLLFARLSSIGASYGLSLMTLVWLAAVLLGWFILRKTFLGRSVFAIGGNEVAAERLGIAMLRTRLFAFGFVGLLSGVAAVVHLSIV